MNTITAIRALRDEIENAAYIEDKLDRYARRELEPRRRERVDRDLARIRRLIETDETRLRSLLEEAHIR